MKINKWRALRDATFLVDQLPEKPLGWGIGGSCTSKERGVNDIDVMLIYAEEKKSWMKDKKVWLEGWGIPFDLFFFIPPAHLQRHFLGELNRGWRDETISPPSLKTIRELIY